MSKNISIQTKEKSNPLLLIVPVIILVGSFLFFYVNPLELKNLYKIIILLVGVAFAVFVFFRSAHGATLWLFLIDTKIELRKVVWPTREETIKTTGMVLVVVIIIAIFLYIIDWFFSLAVQSLMG